MQAAELPVTFIGPVEDESNTAWHVEQSVSAQYPVKMRAHPIEAQSISQEKMNDAVEVARSISHDGIARVYGYTQTSGKLMVLTEDLTGLGLCTLLVKNAERSLDPRLFLWLSMELIRIVDEVMSQLSQDALHYQILHGMDASNVWITHHGQPKLVGLRPKLNHQNHDPVTGIVKILREIIARCAKSVNVDGQNVFTEEMFDRLLHAANHSISELESQVEREFFRTYKTDESQHGQEQWKELALPYLSSQQTDEQQTYGQRQNGNELTQTSGKGDFTRALESRHGPVMPQPLTFADRVTGIETSVFSGNAPTDLNPPLGKKVLKSTSTEANRLLWFTLGFVSAIALMVLYISISLK